MNWSRLFPPGQPYEGPQPPFYFLILVAIMSTVRSLVQMFFPDGGAEIIAGIDVGIVGGKNIIAMFGQWGASQLLLALVYWLVILRYRSLTPLMLAGIALEQLLRLGVGQIKPLEIAAPPPGAVGSELLLPVALIAFIWSLWPNPRAEIASQSKSLKAKKKK